MSLALLLAACGDSDSDESSAGTTTTTEADAEADADATTSTTESELEPTTTTTTEPGVTFAALSEDQQQVIDRICEAATEFGLVPLDDVNQVLVGEAGVPALEEEWAVIVEEAGENLEVGALAAAAVPICDEIGWVATTYAVIEHGPCNFLTEEQVVAAVGAELLDTDERDRACEYAPANEAIVTVAVSKPDQCTRAQNGELFGLADYEDLGDGSWWSYGRDELADSYLGSLLVCSEDGSISISAYQRNDDRDASLARTRSLMNLALASVA